MTKSKRNAMVDSRRKSLPKTPKRRNTIVKASPASSTPNNSNDVDGEEDSDGGLWDFDAPKYYDFAGSRTPGQQADKWFGKLSPLFFLLVKNRKRYFLQSLTT